ncbi:hypothetical protein [Acetobacter conturbans]|uniref:Uncharacterized protein n=1 Tax=Acetobacter conturbans TaxID=1737472 RepID=A0ABX0JWB0_9PROT|nr:hypothetical protein [Acetobacter conturbans]NHN87677.1 hypothetical protein [Acetobacter conturbans]
MAIVLLLKRKSDHIPLRMVRQNDFIDGVWVAEGWDWFRLIPVIYCNINPT